MDQVPSPNKSSSSSEESPVETNPSSTGEESPELPDIPISSTSLNPEDSSEVLSPTKESIQPETFDASVIPPLSKIKDTTPGDISGQPPGSSQLSVSLGDSSNESHNPVSTEGDSVISRTEDGALQQVKSTTCQQSTPRSSNVRPTEDPTKVFLPAKKKFAIQGTFNATVISILSKNKAITSPENAASQVPDSSQLSLSSRDQPSDSNYPVSTTDDSVPPTIEDEASQQAISRIQTESTARSSDIESTDDSTKVSSPAKKEFVLQGTINASFWSIPLDNKMGIPEETPSQVVDSAQLSLSFRDPSSESNYPVSTENESFPPTTEDESSQEAISTIPIQSTTRSSETESRDDSSKIYLPEKREFLLQGTFTASLLSLLLENLTVTPEDTPSQVPNSSQLSLSSRNSPSESSYPVSTEADSVLPIREDEALQQIASTVDIQSTSRRGDLESTDDATKDSLPEKKKFVLQGSFNALLISLPSKEKGVTPQYTLHQIPDSSQLAVSSENLPSESNYPVSTEDETSQQAKSTIELQSSGSELERTDVNMPSLIKKNVPPKTSNASMTPPAPEVKTELYKDSFSPTMKESMQPETSNVSAIPPPSEVNVDTREDTPSSVLDSNQFLVLPENSSSKCSSPVNIVDEPVSSSDICTETGEIITTIRVGLIHIQHSAKISTSNKSGFKRTGIFSVIPQKVTPDTDADIPNPVSGPNQQLIPLEHLSSQPISPEDIAEESFESLFSVDTSGSASQSSQPTGSTAVSFSAESNVSTTDDSRTFTPSVSSSSTTHNPSSSSSRPVGGASTSNSQPSTSSNRQPLNKNEEVLNGIVAPPLNGDPVGNGVEVEDEDGSMPELESISSRDTSRLNGYHSEDSISPIPPDEQLATFDTTTTPPNTKNNSSSNVSEKSTLSSCTSSLEPYAGTSLDSSKEIKDINLGPSSSTARPLRIPIPQNEPSTSSDSSTSPNENKSSTNSLPLEVSIDTFKKSYGEYFGKKVPTLPPSSTPLLKHKSPHPKKFHLSPSSSTDVPGSSTKVSESPPSTSERADQELPERNSPPASSSSEISSPSPIDELFEEDVPKTPPLNTSVSTSNIEDGNISEEKSNAPSSSMFVNVSDDEKVIIRTVSKIRNYKSEPTLVDNSEPSTSKQSKPWKSESDLKEPSPQLSAIRSFPTTPNLPATRDKSSESENDNTDSTSISIEANRSELEELNPEDEMPLQTQSTAMSSPDLQTLEATAAASGRRSLEKKSCSKAQSNSASASPKVKKSSGSSSSRREGEQTTSAEFSSSTASNLPLLQKSPVPTSESANNEKREDQTVTTAFDLTSSSTCSNIPEIDEDSRPSSKVKEEDSSENESSSSSCPPDSALLANVTDSSVKQLLEKDYSQSITATRSPKADDSVTSSQVSPEEKEEETTSTLLISSTTSNLGLLQISESISNQEFVEQQISTTIVTSISSSTCANIAELEEDPQSSSKIKEEHSSENQSGVSDLILFSDPTGSSENPLLEEEVVSASQSIPVTQSPKEDNSARSSQRSSGKKEEEATSAISSSSADSNLPLLQSSEHSIIPSESINNKERLEQKICPATIESSSSNTCSDIPELDEDPQHSKVQPSTTSTPPEAEERAKSSERIDEESLKQDSEVAANVSGSQIITGRISPKEEEDAVSSVTSSDARSLPEDARITLDNLESRLLLEVEDNSESLEDPLERKKLESIEQATAATSSLNTGSNLPIPPKSSEISLVTTESVSNENIFSEQQNTDSTVYSRSSSACSELAKLEEDSQNTPEDDSSLNNDQVLRNPTSSSFQRDLSVELPFSRRFSQDSTDDLLIEQTSRKVLSSIDSDGSSQEEDSLFLLDVVELPNISLEPDYASVGSESLSTHINLREPEDPKLILARMFPEINPLYSVNKPIFNIQYSKEEEEITKEETDNLSVTSTSLPELVDISSEFSDVEEPEIEVIKEINKNKPQSIPESQLPEAEKNKILSQDSFQRTDEETFKQNLEASNKSQQIAERISSRATEDTTFSVRSSEANNVKLLIKNSIINAYGFQNSENNTEFVAQGSSKSRHVESSKQITSATVPSLNTATNVTFQDNNLEFSMNNSESRHEQDCISVFIEAELSSTQETLPNRETLELAIREMLLGQFGLKPSPQTETSVRSTSQLYPEEDSSRVEAVVEPREKDTKLVKRESNILPEKISNESQSSTSTGKEVRKCLAESNYRRGEESLESDFNKTQSSTRELSAIAKEDAKSILGLDERRDIEPVEEKSPMLIDENSNEYLNPRILSAADRGAGFSTLSHCRTHKTPVEKNSNVLPNVRTNVSQPTTAQISSAPDNNIRSSDCSKDEESVDEKLKNLSDGNSDKCQASTRTVTPTTKEEFSEKGKKAVKENYIIIPQKKSQLNRREISPTIQENVGSDKENELELHLFFKSQTFDRVPDDDAPPPYQEKNPSSEDQAICSTVPKVEHSSVSQVSSLESKAAGSIKKISMKEVSTSTKSKRFMANESKKYDSHHSQTSKTDSLSLEMQSRSTGDDHVEHSINLASDSTVINIEDDLLPPYTSSKSYEEKLRTLIMSETSSKVSDSKNRFLPFTTSEKQVACKPSTITKCFPINIKDDEEDLAPTPEDSSEEKKAEKSSPRVEENIDSTSTMETILEKESTKSPILNRRLLLKRRRSKLFLPVKKASPMFSLGKKCKKNVHDSTSSSFGECSKSSSNTEPMTVEGSGESSESSSNTDTIGNIKLNELMKRDGLSENSENSSDTVTRDNINSTEPMKEDDADEESQDQSIPILESVITLSDEMKEHLQTLAESYSKKIIKSLKKNIGERIDLFVRMTVAHIGTLSDFSRDNIVAYITQLVSGILRLTSMSSLPLELIEIETNVLERLSIDYCVFSNLTDIQFDVVSNLIQIYAQEIVNSSLRSDITTTDITTTDITTTDITTTDITTTDITTTDITTTDITDITTTTKKCTCLEDPQPSSSTRLPNCGAIDCINHPRLNVDMHSYGHDSRQEINNPIFRLSPSTDLNDELLFGLDRYEEIVSVNITNIDGNLPVEENPTNIDNSDEEPPPLEEHASSPRSPCSIDNSDEEPPLLVAYLSPPRSQCNIDNSDEEPPALEEYPSPPRSQCDIQDHEKSPILEHEPKIIVKNLTTLEDLVDEEMFTPKYLSMLNEIPSPPIVINIIPEILSKPIENEIIHSNVSRKNLPLEEPLNCLTLQLQRIETPASSNLIDTAMEPSLQFDNSLSSKDQFASSCDFTETVQPHCSCSGLPSDSYYPYSIDSPEQIDSDTSDSEGSSSSSSTSKNIQSNEELRKCMKYYRTCIENMGPDRSYQFVYNNTDTLETEIAEWYSYSEEHEFCWNLEAFQDQMFSLNYAPTWSVLKPEQRQDVIMQLLNKLESNDRNLRMKAARVILYIAQGCWGDVTVAENQKAASRQNVFLLYKAGVFAAFITLLHLEMSRIKKFNERKRNVSDSEEIRVILSVLYTITEVIRNERETDKMEFKEEIQNFFIEMLEPENHELLGITLLQMLQNIFENSAKYAHLPTKKILLMLWKWLLVTLGGTEPDETKPTKRKRELFSVPKAEKPSKRLNVSTAANTGKLPKNNEDVPRQNCKTPSTGENNIYPPVRQLELTRGNMVVRYPFTRFDQIRSGSTEVIYEAMLPKFSCHINILMDFFLQTFCNDSCSFPYQGILRDVIPIKSPTLAVDYFKYIVDVFRHKEITLKAISAILLLLLKRFKTNNRYQFEFLSQSLVLYDCIPRIVSFFDQDIVTYIKTENRVAGWEFPHCVIKDYPPVKIGNPYFLGSMHYSWRNVFLAINFIQILYKITKRRQHRIRLMLNFSTSYILGKASHIRNPIFQKYVLDILKVLARERAVTQGKNETPFCNGQQLFEKRFESPLFNFQQIVENYEERTLMDEIEEFHTSRYFLRNEADTSNLVIAPGIEEGLRPNFLLALESRTKHLENAESDED